MEEKDLLQIRKIMKWVFIGSALAYAAIITIVYTLLSGYLSGNIKLIVISVAPMVVAGAALLILKYFKGASDEN